MKNIRIFLSENFTFLAVKFSISFLTGISIPTQVSSNEVLCCAVLLFFICNIIVFGNRNKWITFQ